MELPVSAFFATFGSKRWPSAFTIKTMLIVPGGKEAAVKFGSVATRNAEGAILAHTIRLEDGALKKGQRLSAADVDRLSTAGIDAIVAASLETGDCLTFAALTTGTCSTALPTSPVPITLIGTPTQMPNKMRCLRCRMSMPLKVLFFCWDRLTTPSHSNLLMMISAIYISFSHINSLRLA